MFMSGRQMRRFYKDLFGTCRASAHQTSDKNMAIYCELTRTDIFMWRNSFKTAMIIYPAVYSKYLYTI